MKARITHTPEAATHKWAVTVYEGDEYLFGVAIDASTEEEVERKVKRLWDDYILAWHLRAPSSTG